MEQKEVLVYSDEDLKILTEALFVVRNDSRYKDANLFFERLGQGMDLLFSGGIKEIKIIKKD